MSEPVSFETARAGIKRGWLVGAIIAVACMLFGVTGAAANLHTSDKGMGKPPGENIARGKPYTLSPRPNYRHCTDVEDAEQLTNGAYSEGYFWVQESTVGWNGAGLADITIDLGKVQPIAGVSYNTAAGVAGVAWPNSIFIYVSNDGKSWWRVGELTALSARHGSPPREDYAVHRFWTGDIRTRGRYVKLLVAGGSAYIFCDEVEVYRGPDRFLAVNHSGKPTKSPATNARRQLTTSAVRKHVLGGVERLKSKVMTSGVDTEIKKQLQERLEQIADAALKAEITDPDFKAIVPYNNPHRQMLKTRAALWRARGRPRFDAWQCNRYRPIQPDVPPPENAPPPGLDMVMMQNEVRADVINITCAGEDEVMLGIKIAGLPGSPTPEFIEVRRTLWTGTRGGDVVASALPAARQTGDGWTMDITPGLTSQLWVSVDSTNIGPGQYRGTISILAGDHSVGTIPIDLRVSELRLPDRLTLTLGGWDYTNGFHRGITPENRMATVKFLKHYHVNAPWATSSVMPFGTHDDDGTMVQQPDTQNMDQWLDRWQDARYYCIFNSFHSPVPDADAGRRRVEEWISFWVSHLEKRGISPDQLCLLISDEPHDEKEANLITSYASIIQEIEPEVNVWEDPTWRDPTEAPQRFFELCDILCPNRPMWIQSRDMFEKVYLPQKDAGRKLAFYSCSGPVRSLDPYSYHRLQAWDCFRYGATQQHFWAFGDNGGGSAWNEFAADGNCYTPQFLGPQGCITSKHMEAIREGLYDYEYMVMLRDVIEAAGNSGKVRAETIKKAQSLLESAPNRVTDAEGADSIKWVDEKDRSLADRTRLQILRTIEHLGP